MRLQPGFKKELLHSVQVFRVDVDDFGTNYEVVSIVLLLIYPLTNGILNSKFVCFLQKLDVVGDNMGMICLIVKAHILITCLVLYLYNVFFSPLFRARTSLRHLTFVQLISFCAFYCQVYFSHWADKHQRI